MAPASLEMSQLRPVDHANLAGSSSTSVSGTTLTVPGSVSTATPRKNRSASPQNRYKTVPDPAIPSKMSHMPPTITAHLPRVNHDDVFKAAFPLWDKDISELLECDYDSMAPYHLTPDEEGEKVRAEITRLASVVEKSDNVLLFTPRNNNCVAAFKASKDGYIALADVVAYVVRALRICRVDNDSISLLNAKIDISPEKFKLALARLDPDFYIKKKSQTAQSKDGTVAPAPAVPSYESCCDLVDFITASIARVMTQMANGDSWHNSVLAVLAKLAAKMKMLLDDLENITITALSNGESALESYMCTFGKSNGSQETQLPDPETIFRESSKSGSGDTFYMHCVEQQKIRAGPHSYVGYVLQALGGSSESGSEPGLPITAYEMLSVVIDTGYEGFKSHLCQDRDYEFSSTSDRDDLNFAHPGFNILIESIEHIRSRDRDVPIHRPPPPRSQDPAPLTTKIEWGYATDGPLGKTANGASLESSLAELELRTMGDIASVMTPLFLTSPYIACNAKSFLNMFYLTADVADEVRPYPEVPYNVFVRLYTSSFRAPNATNVLQLADAIHKDLFSRDFLLEPHASRGGIIPRIQGLLPRKKTDPSHELQRLMDEMSAWVYVQNAVIIRCRFYVFMTMVFAGVLVGGGLTIGLALGTRLKGVDPFNITVYAWALAAFLALVAKSIKVRDWAWADFLHGRVVCRSVSELSSMTGYSTQLILAKLLHDEKESILMTRGPYNSVFEHRAKDDSDGFSIDLPVKTRTLLLSGLTMLKVETPLGHGLVCLDARRGSPYSSIVHRSCGEKKTKELICQDIDRLKLPNSNKKGNGAVGIALPMKWSEKLEWRRIEGVYSELDAAYV
ncbi:hypothetical protein F4777DRAFT_192303 [Nemania sp. FL0916]|nr:hypothetical protein F4777DRAFT_192303 [Nemania sp. FL0916]